MDKQTFEMQLRLVYLELQEGKAETAFNFLKALSIHSVAQNDPQFWFLMGQCKLMTLYTKSLEILQNNKAIIDSAFKFFDGTFQTCLDGQFQHYEMQMVELLGKIVEDVSIWQDDSLIKGQQMNDSGKGTQMAAIALGLSNIPEDRYTSNKLSEKAEQEYQLYLEYGNQYKMAKDILNNLYEKVKSFYRNLNKDHTFTEFCKFEVNLSKKINPVERQPLAIAEKEKENPYAFEGVTPAQRIILIGISISLFAAIIGGLFYFVFKLIKD